VVGKQRQPVDWSVDKASDGALPIPISSSAGGTTGQAGCPRHDKENIFAWSYVELNLRGSSGYDPARPWISKRRADGRIAGDISLYVDDNRKTAATQEFAWRASSRMAKTCGWLGLQDAARKRREPSVHPGAWAGSVVHVEDDAVYKLVTQELWDKTKAKIDWIWKEVQEIRAGIKTDHMDYKTLESYRGFLIYVAQTYTTLVPYLKGIHLTLDSWRPNRDDDGWKISNTLEEKFAEAIANVGNDSSRPGQAGQTFIRQSRRVAVLDRCGGAAKRSRTPNED